MSSYTFPVAGGGRLSSGYGRRASPFPGASSMHKGIDIAAPRGTPVVAPAGLKITVAGQQRGYGNVIYGVDAQGIEHRFAHLDAINVQQGQSVAQGVRIGALGSTGNSSGPHLHYETRKGGKSFDPSGLLKGAGKQALSAGKSALKDAGKDLLMAAGASNPVTAPIVAGLAVADGLGLTGGKSWLEQFRDWLRESGFFQRLALAIFAFIILFAAFYLMKGNVVSQVTGKLGKALA